MSNPAVVKLQSGKIGPSKFWMDDNFGESIHIHIDDIRVDLNVAEFKQLYEDVCTTLTKLVNVDNFDARKMDPVFLSLMLGSSLSKLERVSYDKVNLGDMLAPYHEYIYKLADSVGVKALKGVSNEGDGFRKSHHIGQTEAMRMDAIVSSIKQNGYPYNDNYIVLYGDDNIIRDGQHRASALYYLYGDMEVPVLRMYFKDYTTPEFSKNGKLKKESNFKKVKRKSVSLCKFVMGKTKKTMKKIKALSSLGDQTKTVNPELEELFKAK